MLKFYWGASLAVLLVATPALAQETSVPLQDENTATTDPKRDRSEASDILVMGQRAATPSLGALGDRPILDSSFSISTYDGALLKDIQARSMTDLLRLDPSATTSLTDVTEGSGTRGSARCACAARFHIGRLPRSNRARQALPGR